MWRAGLKPEEAAQWEGALGAMKPGPDLVGRLTAFRFRGHEGEDAPVRGAAVILDRLKAAD